MNTNTLLTYNIPLIHETIISKLTTDAIIFNSKIQLLNQIQIMLTRTMTGSNPSIATTRLAERQQLRVQTTERQFDWQHVNSSTHRVSNGKHAIGIIAKTCVDLYSSSFSEIPFISLLSR